MNQKKSLRNCPICQEENGEILHTQNFVLPEGHPLSNGYDILCCDQEGSLPMMPPDFKKRLNVLLNFYRIRAFAF